MTQKIKVLQLQNRYNVNASDLAEQIIQGLPTEQFEITTAFLKGHPGTGEPESKAQRSIYFNFSQSSLSGLRIKALWSLYQLCKRERFDVIIAHRFKPMSMLMWLNIFLPIPLCIGVQHGIGDFDRAYRRWEAKRLIRKNWKIVGVSKAVCDYLIGCNSGFTCENTVQINNAIDISRVVSMQYDRAQAREVLGLPASAFIFGTIGRLVPVKGHIFLLEAFALLSQDYPEAVVAIIGEGRSRDELEARISALGLQDRVYLLGAHPDALKYVKAFDVFVMPSLSEGLPLALLEGLSGKIPVIGSDIDSLRSILEECGGHIFPPGNSLLLSQLMRDLLDMSVEDREVEGNRNYSYLTQAHSIDEFRTHYLKIIKSCKGE